MSKPTEIIPGVGLGELIFGSSFQETRAILGDPDDIGRSEEEDEDSGEISISEMWTYGSLGVTAHFDEDDDFKLGMLSVNVPQYKLEGLSLFCKKEVAVLDLLHTRIRSLPRLFAILHAGSSAPTEPNIR